MRRASLLLAILLAVAGIVVSNQVRSQTDYDVAIVFDADACPVEVRPNADVSCPRNPDKSAICADRGRQIVWQSVNAADEPMSLGYEIFFDPFVGRPLDAGPTSGLVRATIRRDVPAVEYKYTVVGDNCPDKPLDPRIIID
ncbi:MAG: hypothetical protein P8172_11290 [Gammaproteobacteria bacterium]